MLRFTLHSLLVGFVRRTWLVALATMAVCSVLTARTVAALSAEDPVVVGAPLSPTPPEPPPRPAPDGSAFVTRNIFCSTCGPIDRDPRDPTDASFSGRTAVLISTTTAPDPIATLRVPETEVQGSWALSERIPGVGTITRIGHVSIDLVDDRGRMTTLSLRAPAAARIEEGAATPSSPQEATPFGARVKKVSEHVYEVDRELVRELVTGATKPGKVRLVPIFKDNEIKGVRMFGVHPGSAPAAVGVRNGDVLDTIDGEPIKTAQHLLDLYAKLDQLSNVVIGGTRGGKPLAITLQLR